jgi:muramidase (phage lysozyme)
MKNILNKLLIGVLLIVPNLAQAQLTLVPGDDLSICDIFVVMENLFTLLLLTTSGAVALTIVIGGAQMIISGGNPSVMNDGVKMVQNGITGLIMLAASIIILNTILLVFGVGGSFGSLVTLSESGFEITCNQSGPLSPESGGGTVNTGLANNPTPGGGGVDSGGGTLPGGGAGGVANLAIGPNEASPELRAYMRALTYAEGTPDAQGYYRLTGGTMYNGATVHPGVTDPTLYQKTGLNSDAFGRYQMLSTTWNEWAAASNIPLAQAGTNSRGEPYYNMSPVNQDRAVAGYLRRQGVEGMLKSGNVQGAVSRTAGTWSSLPGGSQPNDRTSSFYATYERMLAEERARQ